MYVFNTRTSFDCVGQYNSNLNLILYLTLIIIKINTVNCMLNIQLPVLIMMMMPDDEALSIKWDEAT